MFTLRWLLQRNSWTSPSSCCYDRLICLSCWCRKTLNCRAARKNFSFFPRQEANLPGSAWPSPELPGSEGEPRLVSAPAESQRLYTGGVNLAGDKSLLFGLLLESSSPAGSSPNVLPPARTVPRGLSGVFLRPCGAHQQAGLAPGRSSSSESSLAAG